MYSPRLLITLSSVVRMRAATFLSNLIRAVNDVCLVSCRQSVVERYEWSEELQGMILGSFYIGYVLMHLPGAVLAERFGGKFVIIVGLGCTAILTIGTPVAIAVGEAWALMAIRIVIGVCQGAMWPALSTIMASWVPITERGSLGALVFSGISVIMHDVCLPLILFFDIFSYFVFCSVAILWAILRPACYWTIIEIGTLFSTHLELLASLWLWPM